MDYKTAIEATLNGDNDGFTFLFESTYTKMYHKALSYVKNECDAEDVLQDSYMKARRSLETLSEPEKFPSWLSSIVVNTSKNYLKKKKPLMFLDFDSDSEDDEIDTYDIEDDDTLYQPEKSYSDKEVSSILHDMIDSLSDEQRLCILMYHFDDRSIRDIAETISCSENTVKSRLSYGRKALRKKVEAMQKEGYSFYGAAPIPMFKYFMEKDCSSSAFRKIAKTAMENSSIITASNVNTAADATAVTVVNKTVGKRILTACVAAAVIGGGMLTCFSLSNNGFVDLFNHWDKDENSLNENIGEEYLNYIAGSPTKDELEVILSALPDNYSFESLVTSEYQDMTEYFCYKIKDDSVIMSSVYDDNNYNVDDINRLFSIFSNYIISENNYDSGSYHNILDVGMIECEVSEDYANAEVEIIDVALDDENNVMTIDFSRKFDKTSENDYAIENEEYSGGEKQATLEPDVNGSYRIRLIQEV